jgi:hypothetical protein
VSRLRVATAVLAVIGIGIAGYLTYVHYAGINPICVAGSGGCEKVQTSKWADLGGIPVAVLGLAGYVCILGSLLLPEELGQIVAEPHRRRLLGLPDLPRAVHDPRRLPVVRGVGRDHGAAGGGVGRAAALGRGASASPHVAIAHRAIAAPVAISRW